jgi:hypothetical protein
VKRALLFLLVTGCGAQSTYTPTRASNNFVATKGGKEIASAGSWGGLEEAVGCVPEARELASGAESRGTAGKALLIGGGVVMIAGLVAGTVMLFTSEKIGDNLGTSLGLMGGGVVLGGTGMIVGAGQLAGAQWRGFDAVNIYNDRRASCTRATATRR